MLLHPNLLKKFKIYFIFQTSVLRDEAAVGIPGRVEQRREIEAALRSA